MNNSLIQIDAREAVRLADNLRAYIDLTGKEADEVLNKKGTDLSYQLYTVYRVHKWKALGGKGKEIKDIGFRELQSRTSAGIGTRVRDRAQDSKYFNLAPKYDKNGKPLSKWQLLVFQETAKRQRGTGFLAVTWLPKRQRNSVSKGRSYLLENTSRKSGVIMRFSRQGDTITLTGYTPGLSKVNRKYGLADKAVRNVSLDIESYLKRKVTGEPLKAFKYGGAKTSRF